MPYGIDLRYLDQLNDYLPLQFGEENLLVIVKDDTINHLSLPISLVYQNNQDRQISLTTSRDTVSLSDDQQWIFYVENVISFAWETKGTVIRYCFHELATEDIFRFWLYHVVLPISLSISQKYRFLHAGAVEIAQKAVLFMAPSFGGKSTLTDYFLQRGHSLMTDDKMATYEANGVYYAVPSHPYHRPFRTVEVLGHLSDNPSMHIRPIHVIYILEKSEPDGEIVIRKLKGVEKFARLYEGGEMNFSFFTPQYVTYMTGLANAVNVFNIKVPHDLQRLEEVYQTIIKHSATL